MRMRYCFSKPPQPLISAAPGVGPQGRPDHPVLEGANPRSGWSVCYDEVVKDFAEAGGDGAEVGRSVPSGSATDEAFRRQLAGEVNVGAVVEDDGDLGQAEFGERTHLLKVRQCRRDLARWAW